MVRHLPYLSHCAKSKLESSSNFIKYFAVKNEKNPLISLLPSGSRRERSVLGLSTVSSEIFAIILFSLIALKDMFATLKICD